MRKKRWLMVLGTIGALLGMFVFIVIMQPSNFTVARSTTIATPASVPFALVNDFHKMHEWSPFAKRDPNMKVTYTGPDAGKGAQYSWAGDSNVGEGRMTITDSDPDKLVRINLEFIKPFETTNTAEFTFEPDQANQTKVTWSMHGEHNFISKAMCLFMDMDKMVGTDFEAGLATLKSMAESSAP